MQNAERNCDQWLAASVEMQTKSTNDSEKLQSCDGANLVHPSSCISGRSIQVGKLLHCACPPFLPLPGPLLLPPLPPKLFTLVAFFRPLNYAARGRPCVGDRPNFDPTLCLVYSLRPGCLSGVDAIALLRCRCPAS